MKRLTDLFVSIFAMFLMFFITSCDDEIVKPYDNGGIGTITFQSVGLTFSSEKDGAVHAEIPASGCSFSITPDDEFKDSAFITAVCIDDEDLVQPVDFSGEPPYLTSLPILSGEWGDLYIRLRMADGL